MYGAGFCPSPYLGNSLNPNYLIYKFGEYKNAFNDFDGLGNTTILSKNSDYLAANGAWRYKDGSTSSQWYLPSIGELAIVFARINNINITLKMLCKQIINYTLWSSTDNGDILLPLALDGNIWKTRHGECFYNDCLGVRPITMLELITFTIGGVECQAEEGMTWADWYVSNYNSDVLAQNMNPPKDSIYENLDMNVMQAAGALYDEYGNSVYFGDVIIKNHTYKSPQLPMPSMPL
jgi:hypothetical protein